jgi:hypothetical protein
MKMRNKRRVYNNSTRRDYLHFPSGLIISWARGLRNPKRKIAEMLSVITRIQ